ncbi:peptidylprolyl isomerase [Flavihumibacter solisilvae]|uniref:peptidylprolyl isomerase n=1 Tax=Flavihumibacter solisilvae TaxID=1349421 RepID=A0A0C1LLS0_9BACT|nr:peptidylprolyl isomerase [Flavihumibacter solisilvae]KIC96293.1 peptidylprolyl isomerase [Flavihumibacter solisilvae]
MRRIFVLLLISMAAGTGCRSDSDNGNIRVEIETGEGDIVIELYPKKAPQSVKAFLEIVDKGYYNNCSFYRVLNNDNQPSNAPKAELVQGGLWNRTKKRPELPKVVHETTQQTGLHHKRGTVSLARESPGTATSEFFICMEDQPGLDFGGENNPDGQGYAAFGRVIKGMDVVNKIFRKPESDQYFDPPVPIYSIERY